MNYGISTISNVREWMQTNTKIAFAIKTIIGSIIMALSAQVTIPTPFVPITGGTLGLTIIGLSLGRYVAVSSILLYIAEGVSGLPVFSGGGFGIAHVLGSSGGYLLGYIPAAFIMGFFSDKGCRNSFVKTAVAILLGHIALYTFGLLQLSLFVPNDKVLTFGLIPFIAGDVIKIITAILVAPTAYKLFSKIK